MIRFLRHIRKRLLNQNRVSKYLVYAVGEIALVMIGILLALQVNNWNEDRKNSDLIVTYKKSLVDNLEKDRSLLIKRIDNIKSELALLEQFEERVSQSIYPFDTILKIARYEYNFIIAIQYDFENDTYNALNTTGHIGLFEEDLIKDLNELSNLQERAIFSAFQTFETYRNGLSSYSRKYPFTFKTNLIQNGTLAADMIWDQISPSQHATEFNALVIAKGDSYRLSMDMLPDVLEKTELLLARLKKDISGV